MQIVLDWTLSSASDQAIHFKDFLCLFIKSIGEFLALSIAVITPSHNQGKFIERTIRSVITQDASHVEYVVIDGGSTDNTVDILRRYEGRVRWISEKDRGQADAINKGIRMTRNDIIGWLNSDDIYYPGALSAVQSFFQTHPDIEVVYGDADHIDVDDRILEPYYSEDWNYDQLKEICYLCQPAVFFRRGLTDRAGVLDDRLQFCLDYEYWLRLGAVTPFFRIFQKLAGSRMYGENKTIRSRVAVHCETNDMLLKQLGMVPFKWRYGYAHATAIDQGYTRGDPAKTFGYFCCLIRTIWKSYRYWARTATVGEMRSFNRWFMHAVKNQANRFCAR